MEHIFQESKILLDLLILPKYIIKWPMVKIDVFILVVSQRLDTKIQE